MIKGFVFPLFAALVACASPDRPTQRMLDDQAAPLPADYFDDNQRCVAAWRDLVVEWHSFGGSVLPDLDELKVALLQDDKSRLGRLFQEFWHRKLKYPEADPAHTFAEAAEQFVPESCSAYFWLGEQFASVEGVMSEKVKTQLNSQSTTDYLDKDPPLGIWVVSRLLEVRPDAENKL